MNSPGDLPLQPIAATRRAHRAPAGGRVLVGLLVAGLLVFSPDGASADPEVSAPPRVSGEESGPVPTISLPPAGVHPVKALMGRIRELSSLPVIVAHSDLLERPVRITLGVSRARVTLAELRVLLAAHGLFLHEHALPHPVTGERSSGRPVLVLSRDSHWLENRDLRFTRILRVSPTGFRRCVDAIEKFILTLPPTPAGDPALETISIPVRRTGSIILRSPSRRTLDVMVALARGIDRKYEEAREDRPRLYSFRPRNHFAREIQERVLGFLTPAESRRVVLLPSTLGNVLLVKTQPELWAKIQKVLPLADDPEFRRKAAEPTPEASGKTPETPAPGSV